MARRHPSSPHGVRPHPVHGVSAQLTATAVRQLRVELWTAERLVDLGGENPPEMSSILQGNLGTMAFLHLCLP